MKKIFFLLFIPFFCCSVHAQKLNAVLNYSSFCTNDMQPYLEFIFMINGQSTKYALKENGKYQAKVLIKVDIEQADSVVKHFEYVLFSDEFADSVLTTKPDFANTDYVLVPNGDYIIRFYMKDENGTSKPIQYIDNIQVYYPDDKTSISAISLFQQIAPEAQGGGVFAKYGYSMTPLFYSYVPETISTLPFMIEIYNTEKAIGKDSAFLIRSYIESIDGTFLKNNIVLYRREKTSPMSVMLSQFDVSQLPSGNYNVVVEVMNSDSTVLASNKAFFQRSNPSIVLRLDDYDKVDIGESFVSKITDVKIMRDYVASLFPISSPIEQDFYLNRMNVIPLDKLQRYFYSFWLQRNSSNPEQEWLKYKEKVDYVQKLYGSKQVKGYRTDRGRVYLRYGKPNSIIEEPMDPQAYPYEIWHYYVLNNESGQTNVKFVFYNRDQVSNDYELLHSDAIGEHRDPSWQMKLTRRLSPSNNPDITRPDDYWGGHANDNWNIPH